MLQQLSPSKPVFEPGTAKISIAYTPRKIFLPLHARDKRWAIVVAHRRCGKTVACVNELIRGALTCPKERPRFAYVGPTYSQAKDVAWNYVQEYSIDIPGTSPHEGELRLDYPNGGRVRLYGADNYNRMRGIYLDGVVLDEYGDMDPRAWEEVIRPALSDRQGWAIFIGTVRGRNHFYSTYERALRSEFQKDWYVAIHPASATQIIEKGELEDARRIMTPEQYAAEYECSWAAPIVGSYYGMLIEELGQNGDILPLRPERGKRVYTGWDLGVGDSSAIWFAQLIGDSVHVFDYVENHGVGLDWYAGEIQRRNHIYAAHYLPHDIEQREITTGKARIEALRDLGLTPTVVPRTKVEDGINAVRLLLPRCRFDGEKCMLGLEALKHYRREWDTKKKVFSDRPYHDWASHGADAFRTLAQMLPRQDNVSMRKLTYDNKWVV
jgi:hypothetical protein